MENNAIYGGWKAHVQYSIQTMGYDIMLYRRHQDGRMEFMQFPNGPFTVYSVPEGQYNPDLKPTFRIDDHTCRELVTALSKEGVKPKDATKLEGVLESQTKHLDDMRNILKKQGVMS